MLSGLAFDQKQNAQSIFASRVQTEIVFVVLSFYAADSERNIR